MSNPRMINVAIDHGTCNSVIAELEANGPRVIEPSPDKSSMPSCVFIKPQGEHVVGLRARRASIMKDPGDVATTYKPSLGNNVIFKFPASNQTKTDVEIAAMVLGRLREIYDIKTGRTLLSVVITIPAEFNQGQCDATRAAATKAGFKQVELLQEQVAAAKAYGFDRQIEDGTLVVFDIGAGTTDISLLSAHQGILTPIKGAHVGDGQLGGTNMDNALKSLVLKKASFKNSDFTGGIEGTLNLRVEELKIVLSDNEQGEIDVPHPAGKPSSEITVKRSEYEAVIGDEVTRAVELCSGLLEKHSLSPAEIDGIILIGGPSKTPLLLKKLRKAFGNKLRNDVDPMTAVACGAAIYAATCSLNDKALKDTGLDVEANSEIQIQVNAPASAQTKTCLVTVDVTGSSAKKGALTVEIRRLNGGYSSGQIELDEDDVAEINVDLFVPDETKSQESMFQTIVRNREGEILDRKDEPVIWYRLDSGTTMELSNALGIGIDDKETRFHGLVTHKFRVMLPAGETLPARFVQEFVTTQKLEQGKSGVALRAPIVEGLKNLFQSQEDDVMCNRVVGELRIEATDDRITRSVPAGTVVEVTLECDESRKITATADIPMLELDEPFEVILDVSGGYDIDLDYTKMLLRYIKRALQNIREIHSKYPNPRVADGLAKIDKQHFVENIDKELQQLVDAQGADRQRQLVKFYEHVHQLVGTVTEIRRDQTPQRTADLLEKLNLRGEKKQSLEDLRDAYEKAQDDPDTIRDIDKQLQELDFEVRCEPYYNVTTSVRAIGGHMINNAQSDLYDEADKAWDQVIENGGVQSLTDDDLERFKKLDQQLDDTFPDLIQWIREKREENRGKVALQDK